LIEWVGSTECARDRGPYEKKNARRQSEVSMPGNMIVHQETQINAIKWARSLNFLANFQKSGSDKTKEKNRKI
jgi:hypothetical protein